MIDIYYICIRFISPASAAKNRRSTTGQLNNSSRRKSRKPSEDCQPRLIKEYLGELELVPEPAEFQRLNDLDQKFHLMQFEDLEARNWLKNTSEERMNR